MEFGVIATRTTGTGTPSRSSTAGLERIIGNRRKRVVVFHDTGLASNQCGSECLGLVSASGDRRASRGHGTGRHSPH